MKFYGLKLNGKPLGFSTRSNGDADDCDDVSYELEEYTDKVWLVKELSKAKYTLTTSTEWYNAGYTTPINRYIGKDLEIFEVEI